MCVYGMCMYVTSNLTNHEWIIRENDYGFFVILCNYHALRTWFYNRLSLMKYNKYNTANQYVTAKAHVTNEQI